MENPNYVFLPLKDAMACINLRVNLLAVVVEIGTPTPSKGRDYVCTLKVMDPSFDNDSISVTFYSESKTKLPTVKSLGDIVILKRVVMRVHKNEVYALFDKKLSAFALLGGESTGSFLPYQICFEVAIDDHMQTCIGQLRTWLIGHPFSAGVNVNFLLLRDIKTGQYVNIVCKILHVLEIPLVGWIVYLWDGTDCPPIKFCIECDAEGDTLHPLELEPLPLPRSILCSFPSIGTVLRVIVTKSYEGLKGQWVKIRNFICQAQSGLWRGVMMPCTEVLLLSNKDQIVRERKRLYRERLSSNLNRLPLSSFPWPSRITETDHSRARFSTLMDVLTDKEVTFKYKCVVRVVTTHPWQVEDFRSPVTGKYRIRFTLEDPTARIRAGLFDDDGEKFFGGYPANDVLRSKMNKLNGISDDHELASRNPPWVQVCILSFYQDKNDKWGSRKYRIFDTTLIG
ncbi:protection of telomeres protein 1b-like isoform X2 [Aristolochia californica]|uniref:protection of telomeres protein 1b-like isoform X2 n=1 Tax=Aristolochia californica TaxID=171875 RepID=UPI0035D7C253